MFEPLPDVIRLRRKQRNLTQERLAKMAGVSRRQLSLLEDGSNVSLVFLTKVANALELTELPVGALRLRAAPPELASLIVAAEAVATVKEIVGQFADAAGQLDDAAASIDALVERALSVVGPADAIADAAERLEKTPAGARTTSTPGPRSAAKAPARRRAR